MARTGSTRPRFSRRLDCGIESAAVVGERSAALSRMHSLGLPVPSGFAITVDAFRAWRAAGEAIPADVWSEVSWRLEELTGALGRGHGAPTSSLAVCASPPERPPEPLSERGIGRAEGRDQVLVEVPGGPPRHRWADVRRAVETLWRRHAENMGDATAVIVHHLPGGSSGHGVIVSRDPATGSPGAVISFTPAGLLDQREPNAEGVEPAMLRHGLPDVHQAVEEAAVLLETAFGDMCAIRFVVDRGEVWLLDAFVPERSGSAAVRVAVDMIDEGFVGVQDALRRIPLWALEQAQAPVFARPRELEVVSRARPVAPGAAVGAAVFDPLEASERAAAGEAVVLIAPAATAEEVVDQWAPSAVVLAGPPPRPFGCSAFAKRLAVCHALDLVIDHEHESARTASGHALHPGDPLSVDGRHGLVAAGEARLVAAPPDAHLARVLQWCDELRRTAISGVAPAAWPRVATPEAARELGEPRALIDLSREPDAEGRTRGLREMVAALLGSGVSELGLALPDRLWAWDPRPPSGPWRLVVAAPGLTWAARLMAARMPLDKAPAPSSVAPTAASQRG